MAGEALTPEALLATWDALPNKTRTTITEALIAAADAELRRFDTYYPSSYGEVPAVEPLGVLTDPGGVVRVHFHAHHLNYNFAQSGSDWADHYVLVGNAELAGETLGAIAMEMASHTNIRERDWDDYWAHSRDETVAATRLAAIAKLCASPPAQPAPPPREIVPVTLDGTDEPEHSRDKTVAEARAAPPGAMESVRIVRCPCCGSTDAGASEYIYEITRMTCPTCGCSELCDHEQIKDDWNIKYEQSCGATTLPPFVPLSAANAPGFELTGDPNDDTRLLVHSELGYAIAIPGGPRQIAPIGGTHTRCAILELDAAVTVVVREECTYAMTPFEAHLHRELESAAKLRAQQGSALELVHAGRLQPPGANLSMYVSYRARGDADDAMELLSLTLKGEHPRYQAVYVNVRYRTSELDPLAWENLRTALLGHQTWEPGELPALPVWRGEPHRGART